MRVMVDMVLKALAPQFARLYSYTRRPSMAPEQWLRALLLQVLSTMRSERLLIEQRDDQLLFRGFARLNMADPIWDAWMCSKNREPWLEGDVAHTFCAPMDAQPPPDLAAHTPMGSSTPRDASKLIPCRGRHFAGITVQLLHGVFQQSARGHRYYDKDGSDDQDDENEEWR